MVYDLLVIGGGIQGVAVARDAALRGLRVILLERGDFASGTSSRSSKLIHGGIRYLETGQLRLVREALRERALLLDLAPDYVRPLPFLIPHYAHEGRSALIVKVGLTLYAALAGRHPLAAHGSMSAAEALALEPSLRAEGLRGAALYWDAQMDDALLCVAIAMAADRAAAVMKSYTEVTALAPPGSGSAWRARYRDVDTGEEGSAEARCVVNAAGPWAEEIRAMTGATRGAGLRRTRGTHVVLPALTRGRALLLTARSDGRVFFVLPWGSCSLVGTTDVDDGTPPERIAATPEDIRYLLEEAARAIPDVSTGARPLRAFAGLRSLAQGNAILPWANSREHRILEEGTMLTLIGGKYTTHRSLAERVVDLVVRATGARAGRCLTGESPVPGRADAIRALSGRYPGTLEGSGEAAISEAEVAHAVRNERARHLGDVLERRSRLWLDAGAMRRAANQVARWMAAHRGWDEAARVLEVERVVRALDEEGAIIDTETRRALEATA
jgi:glycerol-3-phosphate dehydrogenase